MLGIEVCLAGGSEAASGRNIEIPVYVVVLRWAGVPCIQCTKSPGGYIFRWVENDGPSVSGDERELC